MSSLVLGVDGWKSGWVGVALDDGKFASASSAPNLEALLALFPLAVAVGIDMPIGFPTTEPRRADTGARSFVGKRRSSVFSVLPRSVYETETFAEATVECKRLWGKGLSQQSYALKRKLFEVDDLASRDNRLHEIHPEVSFAAMSKEALAWSKRSWNGQALRINLLARHGLVLPSDIGQAGGAPVDDILDAAACAWSADRLRLGIAKSLPPDPENDEPAIWY